MVVRIARPAISPIGNPPALPEDSQSLMVPGVERLSEGGACVEPADSVQNQRRQDDRMDRMKKNPVNPVYPVWMPSLAHLRGSGAGR